MIGKLKRLFYFPVASYFRFFAGIRLRRWNPKILVVTGSNGKTTLLHLLESQIGDKARYSHHANSSFGIPFDILGLHRKTLLKSEWISLFLKTPFSAFKKPPKERLYVVEADCDRPREGEFLSRLLNPEIVLWMSTTKSHSLYFEHLVKEEKFTNTEEAIAHEFGYYIAFAKKLAIINGDSELMNKQLERTKAKVISIKKGDSLKKYEVEKEGTIFQIANKDEGLKTRGTRDTLDTFKFKYLLPEEVFYSIEMCKTTCEYLNILFNQSFSNFQMPPGRGSIFKGIKNTTIIDSSYNATPSSVKAVIQMYNKMQVEKKWIVVSDMVDLGEEEKAEHEKIADQLSQYEFDHVILMGPRVMKHAFPKLKVLTKNEVSAFEKPKEVLDFLNDNIKGGETILFKGARFLEGVIEHLLIDKKDIKKLPRREKIWEIRRKQWGL